MKGSKHYALAGCSVFHGNCQARKCITVITPNLAIPV